MAMLLQQKYNVAHQEEHKKEVKALTWPLNTQDSKPIKHHGK